MYVQGDQQQEVRRSFLCTLATTGLAGVVPMSNSYERDDSTETVTATTLVAEIDAALTDSETLPSVYEVVNPDEETTAFVGTQNPLQTHLRQYVPREAAQLDSIFVQLKSSDRQLNDPGGMRMKMWMFFPPATPSDTDRARQRLYEHVVTVGTAPAERSRRFEDADETRRIHRRPNSVTLVDKVPVFQDSETDEIAYQHNLGQIRRTTAGVVVFERPFGGRDRDGTDRAIGEIARVLDRYTPQQIIRPDTDTWTMLAGGGD